MGHEQRRYVDLVQEVAQLEPHSRTGVSVERRRRLVEQQHLRIARERTRERHALAFTAGELRRPRSGEMRDPEALEQLLHASATGETHVLCDCQVRKERVVLEYEAHGAVLRGEIDASIRVQPNLSVEHDTASFRTKQSGHGT